MRGRNYLLGPGPNSTLSRNITARMMKNIPNIEKKPGAPMLDAIIVQKIPNMIAAIPMITP